MKVNINGHDHQVEIEADAPLADVVAAAKQLWTDTLQAPRRPGPASAGASTQVAWQPTGFSRWLGEGDPMPVRAGGDTP